MMISKIIAAAATGAFATLASSGFWMPSRTLLRKSSPVWASISSTETRYSVHFVPFDFLLLGTMTA